MKYLKKISLMIVLALPALSSADYKIVFSKEKINIPESQSIGADPNVETAFYEKPSRIDNKYFQHLGIMGHDNNKLFLAYVSRGFVYNDYYHNIGYLDENKNLINVKSTSYTDGSSRIDAYGGFTNDNIFYYEQKQNNDYFVTYNTITGKQDVVYGVEASDDEIIDSSMFALKQYSTAVRYYKRYDSGTYEIVSDTGGISFMSPAPDDTFWVGKGSNSQSAGNLKQYDYQGNLLNEFSGVNIHYNSAEVETNGDGSILYYFHYGSKKIYELNVSTGEEKLLWNATDDFVTYPSDILYFNDAIYVSDGYKIIKID